MYHQDMAIPQQRQSFFFPLIKTKVILVYDDIPAHTYARLAALYLELPG